MSNTNSYMAASLTGPPAWITGNQVINNSIRILVTALPYSVPLSPALGSPYMTFLDKPLQLTRLKIISTVVAALNAWEPRIIAMKVVPVQSGNSLSTTVNWIDVAAQAMNPNYPIQQSTF